MKPKEKEFCRLLALYAEPLRAARAAGYKHPERSVCRLMGREDVAGEVSRLSRQLRSLYENVALSGLYRLAYGGVGDAPALLYREHFAPEELAKLDLSSVSEIKRTDKGVEIRFCDRAKAIAQLFEQLGVGAEKEAGGLIEAMRLSAQALGGRVGADDCEI